MKHWTDKAFIYHILVDRFTGDKSAKNENKYLGGTIKGIYDKLDTIQNMGFNTIWLSPICESKNYHGYHITNYEKVDPHFGTLDDLKALIEETHKRGLRIITDYVPNHCADTHPFFIDAQKKANSVYRNWFYFEEDNSYKCFLGYGELPKLNLDNPETRKYMTAIAHFWCDLGFDGLRIDHAIGPSFNFWNEWMQDMKTSYPDKFFFGEVWCAGIEAKHFDTIHLKKKWEKRHYGISQEQLQLDYSNTLDGVLDFEFRELVLKHIRQGERIKNNNQLAQEVKRHFSKYPKDFKLVLFLDNHDTDRILYECKGDKSLRDEAIAFCKAQKRPFVIYYGTASDMMNTTTIFNGKPYADLAVREILFNTK